MSKQRAFVRYKKSGEIVPGSLIITQGSYPNGPGLWKEITTDLCCENNNTMNYKVYTALLSQDAQSDPMPTVLENTLGGTPVWTRVNTGQYLCTLTGAFPKEKTFCTVTYGYDWGNQVVVYFGHSASPDYTYMYAFSLQGGAANDIMNGPSGNDLYVEIRVYP